MMLGDALNAKAMIWIMRSIEAAYNMSGAIAAAYGFGATHAKPEPTLVALTCQTVQRQLY